MPGYADDESVRAARQRYFECNGLGEGGYGERWVKFEVGPIPVAFPNTSGRVRAVRRHDIHHVLTGYDTHLLGEGEIGAWEVASGCRNHWAAWVLNLLAFWTALFLGPRAVWRAFVRGRRSGNLYAHPWDEALLDRSVGELRRELGVAPPGVASRPGDALAFAGWTAVAALLGAGPTLLLVAGLWTWWTG